MSDNHTVSEKNIARFERATQRLDNIIADCKTESPNVTFYLDANNGLCMLDGSRIPGETGVQETIVTMARLTSSGGDW